MYKKAINNEKGVAIILIAVSVVVLFGFGALAIDVGHLYNVKNQLQSAADAAALAGASEMSGTTFAEMQTSAFDAADRIASRNVADVSDQDGKPIPVKLASGDVTIGVWDGQDFDDTSTDPTVINAVRVNANRAGGANQPRVNNWFAKVFSLLPLGTKFDVSAIGAVAIASREIDMKIVPIAVNEYWLAVENASARPYNDTIHDYPSSFVRDMEVNVYGSPQVTPSPAYGSTFGVLGSYGNSNMGSNNPNGYVNLDFRSDYYTGKIMPANTVDSLYEAKDSTGGCATCNGYFIILPTKTPIQINDQKTTTGVDYLVKGYPDTRLIPTAVYEYYAPNYANKDFPPPYYSPTYDNTPSDCPYATVFYFATSGKDPINFNVPGTGRKVNEYYPEGTRFMALVYDGTHAGGPSGFKSSGGGSLNQLVTIVGYVPIEVDGYSNTNPKGIGLVAGNTSAIYAQNKSVLDPTDGSTMYGHALAPIIQPDTDHNGGCDFISKVKEAQAKFAKKTVRLVGPSLKYGMAAH